MQNNDFSQPLTSAATAPAHNPPDSPTTPPAGQPANQPEQFNLPLPRTQPVTPEKADVHAEVTFLINQLRNLGSLTGDFPKNR